MTTRPGVALIPGPVERLGGDAELDDEIVAQILRLDLAALFLPQPDQRGFVGAHDDPGVRAADEGVAAIMLSCGGISMFTTSSENGNDVCFDGDLVERSI